MSDPLPNELLMEAWKARVGASLERCLTHRACDQGITKGGKCLNSSAATRREEGRDERKESLWKGMFGPKLRSSDLEPPQQSN